MTPENGTEIEPDNLAVSIRRRFEAVGGVNLELPCREPIREPPDFSWKLDGDSAAGIIRERFSRFFRGRLEF